MTLIGPILDDRSYEDLRRELVERIQAYTPEWTDHNESDPGIALLELFAFLGENLLFRFNQIPDATKIAFLRLLGVQLPGPATPATVLVAAGTDAPKGVQMLKGTSLKAGSIPFETTYETHAWPLTALGVVKRRAATENLSDYEKERRREARRRADLEDTDDATFYETVLVPDDPATGDPVDIQLAADGALWIALSPTRGFVRKELAGRSVYIGIGVDESLIAAPGQLAPVQRGDSQTPAQLAADDGRSSTSIIEQGIVLPEGKDWTSDPPPMRWRLWHGPAFEDRGEASPWDTLTVLHDTTRGLTTTGVVQVQLPTQLERPPESAGATDDPPPLADPKQMAAVEIWLQVTRPDAGSTAASAGGSAADSNPAPMPRVAWVGVNAVQAEQATTVTAPELLGVGSGDRGQSFALTKQQILANTVELEVEEVGGWRRWREVEDVDQEPRGERCFSVERAAGLVQFGNGNGPRVPQIGERIRVLRYRFGGGAAGNVPAGAVSKVVGVTGNVKVANPLPAEGGGDVQSVLSALDEIPQTLHRRERAVIPEDFRALAADVPGVGRAEALPLFDPKNRQTLAAGVVTVVVVPKTDLRTPDTPTPDHSLLRRVALHLDARRLLTTEVVVAPPEYVEILLSVGIQVRPGYQVDAVQRWVELILRQYLAPLPPYGPDGGGWPLGRAIRNAELAAVAVQVEGVEYLESLRLAHTVGGAVKEPPVVPLEKWQLPAIGALNVVVGAPPTPSLPPEQPPPGPAVVPLPAEVWP